jgi:hypothetical protein
MVLQNNGAYTTTTGTGWKLWNAGVDGTGQIVTMMDSGLNTKMEHFAENVATHGTIGVAHRKVVAYESFGGGNLCVADSNSADGGHGTKTSQHAVGSISNMTVSPDVTHTPTAHWDNGIARGAKVYFQDIGTDAGSSVSPPLDLGPSITAAIAKGSFVQNHSWSAATNSYDTAASLLDTALFANPNFVATASSGNRGAIGAGTLGSPSTAKNVICVGGNDVSSPNNRSASSMYFDHLSESRTCAERTVNSTITFGLTFSYSRAASRKKSIPSPPAKTGISMYLIQGVAH